MKYRKKWQEVIKSTRQEQPILRSSVLLNAWINLDRIPNKPWLGFEYANPALRVDLKLDYLPAITTDLRQIPLNASKNHNRLKRVKAYIDTYALSSEQAIRNAHKIKISYERLQERTKNIRSGSKTKAFIDYAIATPAITTTNAAAALKISPASVLNILKTLRLREITGQSRYRAWTIWIYLQHSKFNFFIKYHKQKKRSLRDIENIIQSRKNTSYSIFIIERL